MYTIKTENFYLEFTPVGDSILIKVQSDDFMATTCFDTEDFLIADFALQLQDMYDKLEGSAKLQDLYAITDSYIEFVPQKLGHIVIKGQIASECRGARMRGYSQQLRFANDVEQTFLGDFVRALVRDYAKYVE